MPEDPAGRIVALLRERGLTLATAESLTGGLVGAAVTGVPGASQVYRGGVISYATELKARLLGVPSDVLSHHGAVSRATALAMATGVRAATGADWGIATTGVAGPDPQEGHPPGTVWLAVAGPDTTAARLCGFSGDRRAVREQSVGAVLDLLAGCLASAPPVAAG